MKKFVANAVHDDYDRLVQLCDALAMPTGFCLLEDCFKCADLYIFTPCFTTGKVCTGLEAYI